jgi:tetratricopeptide (TPR) repeat protein
LELSPDSSLLVEASDLLEDGKDYYLAGYCCCALAEALGEPGEADGLFERAIANFRKTDSQLGVPNALQRWAKQELKRHNLDRARGCLEEALTLIRQVRNNRMARKLEAELLDALDDLLIACQRPEEAKVFFREACDLYDFLDLPGKARIVSAKI